MRALPLPLPLQFGKYAIVERSPTLDIHAQIAKQPAIAELLLSVGTLAHSRLSRGLYPPLPSSLVSLRFAHLLSSRISLPLRVIPNSRPRTERLHAGTSPVLTVSSSTTMFQALRVMSTHKVSGVGIVDSSTGAFIGNTSGSDLKLYLQNPTPQALHLPVLEFVRNVRNLPIQTVVPALSVPPTASLIYAVAKLAAANMHRVFVTDPITQRPLAVISVEDVVRLIHLGTSHRMGWSVLSRITGDCP